MPSKSKQTGNAKYTIHVPTHDTMGNLLQDLSYQAHNHLSKALGRMIHSLHVEGPYQHGTSTARHLLLVAHDTPEVDSHVKQTATQLAEAANHPVVTVIKESQQGIQPWTMQNKKYDGGPSPVAIVPTPVPLPTRLSPIPGIGVGDVLRSSKARRWLTGDKSLPKL